jgi:hypothetical protein
MQAIEAHKSNGGFFFPDSEANAVIDKFNALPDLAPLQYPHPLIRLQP